VQNAQHVVIRRALVKVLREMDDVVGHIRPRRGFSPKKRDAIRLLQLTLSNDFAQPMRNDVAPVPASQAIVEQARAT
jgi:hypothetical protein